MSIVVLGYLPARTDAEEEGPPMRETRTTGRSTSDLAERQTLSAKNSVTLDVISIVTRLF